MEFSCNGQISCENVRNQVNICIIEIKSSWGFIRFLMNAACMCCSLKCSSFSVHHKNCCTQIEHEHVWVCANVIHHNSLIKNYMHNSCFFLFSFWAVINACYIAIKNSTRWMCDITLFGRVRINFPFLSDLSATQPRTNLELQEIGNHIGT